MGRKRRNYAPQTAEEAENFSVSENVDELINDVAGNVQDNPQESLDAASGSDSSPSDVPLIINDAAQNLPFETHGKDYANHPKFNKFKNHKGSK